ASGKPSSSTARYAPVPAPMSTTCSTSIPESATSAAVIRRGSSSMPASTSSLAHCAAYDAERHVSSCDSPTPANLPTNGRTLRPVMKRADTDGTLHDDPASAYELVSSDYERGRPAYAADAVAYLVGELKLGGGSCVLDLGAGTGKLTRMLVEHGLEV